MFWNLIFFRENKLASDDEIKKKLTRSNSQRDVLNFFLAFLEYISFFSCRVLSWFDENSVIIENFFRLIQTLIVEKKKDWKIIARREFQHEMLNFFFVFLEYISLFSCRVLSWFDENSVIIEKILRLIQILIIEEKKE
jgi:hypothetical protein